MADLSPKCRLETLYKIAREHGMFEGMSEREAYEFFEKKILNPEIMKDYCERCGDLECSKKDLLKT
jgi:hypothetical protein